MGGNALKKYGVFTKRISTSEFIEIGNSLIKTINDKLSLHSEYTKFYHTKNEHGDLDLLVKVPQNQKINFYDFIKNVFNPNAIHVNGGVFSFDYNNFQIDIIPTPEAVWDVAVVYFSYDPLGNIMGKVYHKFNLSYGHNGLYYKYRNFNGVIVRDILISRDVRKIFEFGGFDYDRYLMGFETILDIFNFCVSSKYFNSNIFQYDNLSHIDKKRNKKRKTYNQFLSFINENEKKFKQYEFNEDKSVYINTINEYFPESNLIVELEMENRKNDINKRVSEKFNGNIIMKWLPNIKGKELGVAISDFKKYLGDDYINFILNSDEYIIRDLFLKIYNRYNEKK